MQHVSETFVKLSALGMPFIEISGLNSDRKQSMPFMVTTALHWPQRPYTDSVCYSVFAGLNSEIKEHGMPVLEAIGLNSEIKEQGMPVLEAIGLNTEIKEQVMPVLEAIGLNTEIKEQGMPVLEAIGLNSEIKEQGMPVLEAIGLNSEAKKAHLSCLSWKRLSIQRNSHVLSDCPKGCLNLLRL